MQWRDARIRRQRRLRRVGENLYRYSSSGKYYALFPSEGASCSGKGLAAGARL